MGVHLSICVFNAGLANEKEGRTSAMSEAEGLDEEDDEGDEDEEGGAETEEQSGNESEMNEQEEDVRLFLACHVNAATARNPVWFETSNLSVPPCVKS